MSKIKKFGGNNIPVIAKYLRLSDKDSNSTIKQESNSIINQRELLNHFISTSSEFENYTITEFIDDGYTGTNFSRPNVQRLINKAQTGEIHCIIVKDISRWGRNYLEVGDYLEQKFPLWGVRFISIGEAYDSAKLNGNTGGLNMAFKGLISEMYSQDLSEKVRSGKDAASKSGKIVTSQPTYGYDVDNKNRHKFVINPYEATVIKTIYNLYEEGAKVSEIVKALNANNTTTPKISKLNKGYRSKKGCGNNWSKSTVCRILREEKYTGKWIYGKYRVQEPGSKKVKPMPRSQWIIIDGIIPVIITSEQFLRVQRLINSK